MKKQLVNVIMANSSSNVYEEACKEWYITDERVEKDATCVCGKKHIKYVYTIQNSVNGNVLEPIGRTCVKFFFTKEQWELWKELKKK